MRTRPLAMSGTSVCVCEPHGRSTIATTSGSSLFEMSNTIRPSKPTGTGSPSQVCPAPAFEFEERTRMFPQIVMSPWFPPCLFPCG